MPHSIQNIKYHMRLRELIKGVSRSREMKGLLTTVVRFIGAIITVHFTVTDPQLVNALIRTDAPHVPTGRTRIHVYTHSTSYIHRRMPNIIGFRPPNTQNLLPKIWHKIDYNSACMADRPRPEMFEPTRGGGATRGPTLVAMATTFVLGAESSRLPVCPYLI